MKESIENALRGLINVISLEILNINQENEGRVTAEEREELFEDLAPELIIMASNVILMQKGVDNIQAAIDFSFTTDEGMEYSVATKKVTI